MKTPLLHAPFFGMAIVLMLWASGCDRKPTRVDVPPLNPSAIGKGAMEKYDANGDGAVAGDELEKAASLRDHPDLPEKVIDRNNDGKVTADEVQARVEYWLELKTGIMSAPPVRVTLDGQPLDGATVKFVPEPFMGGAVEEASGVSDSNGSVVLAIADDKLPADLKGFAGMRPGYYTVEITHPSKTIPARFNTQTTLGQEIASDTGSANIVFELKSR